MMLRRLAAEQSGLAGTALVIVLGWALIAVILLTGTLVTAQRIDDKVDVITGEVQPIENETQQVALLDETNRIAADILEAARPLSGQLETVREATVSIDSRVESILATAQDINGTVKPIRGKLVSILDTARPIERGVAAINAKADEIIALVRGIQSDTGNVLGQTGDGSTHTQATNRNIHGHANSIDCKLGGSHCGQ